MSVGIDKPKIGALAPWFGGKRGMASDIVAQVCWDPEQQSERVPAFFAEPFCGSMAVSMAMPDVATHLVNDRHDDLVHFARTLVGPYSTELIERCNRTPCSEAIYFAAIVAVEREQEAGAAGPPSFHSADVEREWHVGRAHAFFVSSWLGPNGMIGTDHTPRFAVRFGPGGGDPATRLRSAAEALPFFVERLRRFTILSRDGVEVLESIQDKPGVVVYVDPPYTRETRVAGDYTHDFEDHGGATMFGAEDDHDRLAKALNRFEHARVVLSYEDCERVRDLYPGWDVVAMARHKNTGNTGTHGGGSSAPEILLVNNGARPMGGGA